MGYECVVGIDPGLTGGLACLSTDGLMVMRMPVIKGGSAKILDVANIVQWIDDCDPDHVFVERQQSMPGQGVASSFRTGQNYGIIIGILAGMQYPVTTVSPVIWKRSMEVPKDKRLARARATEIFPKCAQDWGLARDDGLAESALIAEYGRRKLGIDFSSAEPPPLPPKSSVGGFLNG